jgi:S-adenosylmethionine decarboxylase
MFLRKLNTLLVVLSVFALTSLTVQDLTAQETKHDEYQFTGSHFAASYKECNHAALTDIPKLRQALLDAAVASGAKVLDSCEYIFAPDGFTMVILLSESHASIHTYPEFNACFVDLFTCGHNCSADAFNKSLQSYLSPAVVNEELMDRN